MEEVTDLRPDPKPDELPGGPSGLLTLAAFPPAGYEPPKIDPKVASALDKASTVFDEMAPIDVPTYYIIKDFISSDDFYKKYYLDPLTKSQKDTLSQIHEAIGKRNYVDKNVYKTTGKVPFKNQIWNNSIMIDGNGNIVSNHLTFGYNRMLYSKLISSCMSIRIADKIDESKVNLVCCHDAFLRGLDKVSDYKGDVSKGYMEINMPFMRFMALILSVRMMFNTGCDLEMFEADPIGAKEVVKYINGEEYEDIEFITNYLEKYSDELSKYAVPLTKIVDGKLESAKYTSVTSIIAMANALFVYYIAKYDNGFPKTAEDPLLNIATDWVHTTFHTGLMAMYKPASVRTPEFIQAVDELAKDHPEVWQPALTEDGTAIKTSSTGFILSKYLPSDFERPFKKYYKNHTDLYKEFEPFEAFYDGLTDLSNDNDLDVYHLFDQLDDFFGQMLDNLTDDDFRIPIHIYGISDTYGPTGYDADNTPMSVTKQPDGTYAKNPIIPQSMELQMTKK